MIRRSQPFTDIEMENFSDDDIEMPVESNIRRRGSAGLGRFPPPREPRDYQRSAKAEQLITELNNVPAGESKSFRPRQLSKFDSTDNSRTVRKDSDSEEAEPRGRSKGWVQQKSSDDAELFSVGGKENRSNGSREGWSEAKGASKPAITAIPTISNPPVREIADSTPDDEEPEDGVIEIDVLQRYVKEDSESENGTIPQEPQVSTPKKEKKKKAPKRNPGFNISTATPEAFAGIPRKSGRYDHDDESPKLEVVKDWEKLFSGEAVTQNLVKPIVPFVMRAHQRGQFTDLVQCNIVRCKATTPGGYPTYELYLQEPRKLLCVAVKMGMNRTSNYHLFDMTRGQLGSKLTKKSGNYLGKLRAHNSQRTSYSLVTNSSEKEEIAGIVFEKLSTISFLKEGSQPRCMHVVVPHVDFNKVPIPNKIKDSEENLFVNIIEKGVFTNRAMCFHTKEPVLENGNYRLNFRGRVTKPSVKNFQLVPRDNIDHIVCQFGKTGEDQFNLDFKAPFCALQAFSLALCQFNL